MQTPLAVLALVISTLSLGLHVYTWFGSGPRITVSVGGLGFVEVTNRGRSPITVQFITLTAHDPRAEFPRGLKLVGEKLPYRLESHSSGSWLGAADSQGQVEGLDLPGLRIFQTRSYTVTVKLGNGETITASYSPLSGSVPGHSGPRALRRLTGLFG